MRDFIARMNKLTASVAVRVVITDFASATILRRLRKEIDMSHTYF